MVLYIFIKCDSVDVHLKVICIMFLLILLMNNSKVGNFKINDVTFKLCM